MVRQRGIGMGGDLRCQRRFLGHAKQAWSSRPGSSSARPRAGPLADPAANGGGGGGIVLDEGGDISTWVASIEGSQGSLTDVVGGVRALHSRTLSRRQIFSKPL